VSFDRLTAALSDRYAIERELGQGGMATVYLAQDLKHERKVAIKVLKPELAAVLGADRFVQEIKTTAALQHPHILPLHDSGEADGFLFYVMPFIDGETLRDKLNRETQLGIDEAVKITTEVADALHYAHTQGVVHRDIKPENILMANGRPMVADFGIALALSAAAGGRMTETGMSLGTPHYMSPEQATADKEIGPRSDVYSLASVLYEMLAGEPPHMGGSAQAIIMKIIAEPAAPVTQVRKSVPANVAAAVGKALEKLPADRFASAQAFAAALVNPGFTTASIAGDTRGVAGAGNWLRDPRSIALAIAAVALLGWGITRQGRTGPTEYDVGLPDGAGMSALVTIGFDMDQAGRFVIYQTASDRTSELWYRSLSDATSYRIDGTEAAVMPAVSPDGSQAAFIRLLEGGQWTLEITSLDGRTSVVLTTGADEVNSLDWLDDGRIRLLGNDGKEGRWIDPSGGSSVTRSIFYCIMASELPDPTQMLCGGGGDRLGYVISMGDTTTQATLWRGADSATVFGTHFRVVDGSYLTYLSAGGDLLAAPIDLDSRRVGNAVRMVSGLGRRNYTGAGTYDIAEDGTLVYAQGSNAAVGHLVLAGDAGLDTLRVGAEPFLRFAISPDGGTLATVVESLEGEELRVYDLATGQHTVWARHAEIRQPVWSPEGDRLVFTNQDSLFVGSPVRGIAPVAVAPDLGNFEAYAWQPGDRLVGALWDSYMAGVVNIGSQPVAVDTLVSDATFVRPSPNGRWMAYSDRAINTIWLERFPLDGTRFQVATNVAEPLWLSDSRLAFWLFDDGGIAVDVVDLTPSGSAPVGRRRRWLTLPGFRDTAGQSFNVSPDGRVLYVQGADEEPARFLRVIPNWVEQMKRAVDEAN
jgi:tRNA A-37 threonylcarbamoyl transferase component Bud32